jgi:coenzyme PQQ precursor peptide PqqA
MACRLSARLRPGEYSTREFAPRRAVWPGAQPSGDSLMQWQTPQACDFRFGFEITLYIAAR